MIPRKRSGYTVPKVITLPSHYIHRTVKAKKMEGAGLVSESNTRPSEGVLKYQNLWCTEIWVELPQQYIKCIHVVNL